MNMNVNIGLCIQRNVVTNLYRQYSYESYNFPILVEIN